MNNPYQDQLNQLEEKIQENEQLLADPELGELAKQELENLKKQQAMLEQAVANMSSNEQASSSDPSDTNRSNAILEIRAGAGGDEAKIWGSDLLRMYTRFLDAINMKFEYLDEMVIKLRGKAELDGTTFHPYELFKYESGVHRVQRVPETESQGRIHTSTASVAVLPEIHQSAVEINDEDLTWQFIRSGGAGGQSVNKTSSAVRLTHEPSGIAVSSSRERKQAQNRQIALELLRSQLWEIEEEKKAAKLGKARSAIGRAMRAEKIRTYNYPQNRITDHRINQSWHNLENIIDGDLTKVMLEVKAKLD